MPDSMERGILHVGTMNVPTCQDAWHRIVHHTRNHTEFWPTEVGPRAGWIRSMVPQLDASPALRRHPILRGSYGDVPKALRMMFPRIVYAATPRYNIVDADLFTFDYGVADFALEHTWPAFQQWERGKQGFGPFRRPQHLVGIPAPWEQPGFYGLMELYEVFRDQAIAEITRIVSMTGTAETTIQLDAPRLTVLATYFKGKQRQRLLDKYLALYTEFLGALPFGTQVGVHECNGHFNDVSLGHPRTIEPQVELACALSQATPGNVKLSYVHIPFAIAEKPPTLDPRFYQPLGGLYFTDPDTRLAMGIAHKLGTVEEQMAAQTMVEAYAEPVNPTVVAPICGYGEEKDPNDVDRVLRRLYQLAVADKPWL